MRLELRGLLKLLLLNEGRVVLRNLLLLLLLLLGLLCLLRDGRGARDPADGEGGLDRNGVGLL